MKRAINAALLCLALCAPSPAAQAQGGLDGRLDELTRQIAAEVTAGRKTVVAVVEFADLQGRVTDFGRFVAEELITRLYQTRKFEVIERQLLNRVIAEQKLSLTGVVDPASAQKLGKVLGVEAIVAGSVTNLAQSLRVNARIISTETGRLLSATSVEIPVDASVRGLLGGGGAPAPDGRAAPASEPPARRAAARAVDRDFVVELEGCRRAGGGVTCDLMITNDGTRDRSVTLFGRSSRIFDAAGNDHSALRATLGRQTSSSSVRVGNELIPRTPMKASLHFDDIGADATRVTLEVHASTFKVTFRNVAVR